MDEVLVALAKMLELRPKHATGMYVTSHGVQWGFRTNPKKFPANFVLFPRLDDE